MDKMKEVFKVGAIEFRFFPRPNGGGDVVLTHVSPDGQRVSVSVQGSKLEAWAKRQIRELVFT